MGQAKLRNAEITALKTPLYQSKSGNVKVYKVKSLDKFQQLTTRLPYEFEQMEYLGLQLSDRVLSNMFETKVDAYNELYVGSWQDLVVELTDRNGDGKTEYFAVRLGYEDAVVSVPARQDTMTFTGIEAAFARFALSTNHISWYAHSLEQQGKTGKVQVGLMRTISGEEAAEYYHMAMFAAGELNYGNVYRFLD
jgi:hypothetical protein